MASKKITIWGIQNSDGRPRLVSTTARKSNKSYTATERVYAFNFALRIKKDIDLEDPQAVIDHYISKLEKTASELRAALAKQETHLRLARELKPPKEQES